MIRYDVKRDSILERFEMYDNELSDDYTLFFGMCRVRPDGCRMVNSLLFFDQLNFYDFTERKGFSVSDRQEPIALTDIASVKGATAQSFAARTHYYGTLRVVDNRIFVSYCRGKDGETQESSEIHVFDWEGRRLAILQPDQKFRFFEIDPQTHRLYLYRADEKFYVCDIREMFK